MKSHFKSDITPREEFCHKVADIVANKRNNEYGDPMEVIEKTAKMMELFLDAPWRKPNQFVATDVVAFNEIQKLVRRSYNPLHEDSYIDNGGYASIGYEYIKRFASKIKEMMKKRSN
tara:strand:+ start:2575 stop:2925 length:351 start_codon:yes stop_codon:yes gene_type:complete